VRFLEKIIEDRQHDADRLSLKEIRCIQADPAWE
jgi:hypothetical protein